MARRDPASLLAALSSEYPESRYYLNFSTPLELLVAAILSAQARDEVVNRITPAVFSRFRTAREYASASLPALLRAIKGISFPSGKAAHIRGACRLLVEKHGGKVPETMEELVALPGVGRKTANAILINAFNKTVGIVVDTHVIRVAGRLGWTKEKNPGKIERDLMALFPPRSWTRIPWILKDHGKAVCTAPVPRCSRCVVSASCPRTGVAKAG